MFVAADQLASRHEQKSANVLADQVLTDAGVLLGTVVDVILEVGAEADVVGYEIEASENLSERRAPPAHPRAGDARHLGRKADRAGERDRIRVE